MSNSNDHDRRALQLAAVTLRNLASDHLYSDAFRHRVMNTIPDIGHWPVLFLLRAADRLEAISERLAPPDYPAARLERKRRVDRLRQRAMAQSKPPSTV
jgi:hypothetical protein